MTQQSMQVGPPPGIGALFDLSFTRFITVSFIRVLYILGMVLLGLAWLALVVAGFSQGFFAGLVAIVVASLITVIYLIFLRVWLELIVVIFRIGENTSLIANGQGLGSTGGFPVIPTETV